MKFTLALLTAALLFSPEASAGKLPGVADGPPSKSHLQVDDAEKAPLSAMEQLKMRRRFGLGFSAGGPLALLGLEADVNIIPELSISAGYGTGVDYSTMMLKVRYYLLGAWVSPYIGGGFARWWTSGTNAKPLSPSLLADKFLTPDDDPTKGFNAYLIYPCLGVQFMHHAGFDFYAELQYLFKLVSFANGAYGGLGMHWYF